ncbi:MAG: YciI family protein [Archangiaceae bacterium]|nr:YciI family protein [Archangiaceae bacterium]
MKYLLLVYRSEAEHAKLSPTEQQAVTADYMSYARGLAEAKVLVGAEQLQRASSATTVRTRSGKTTRTDGPFAETKEQLGGYFFIDVPNLEAALDWAAKCPGAKQGCIEVRPIVDRADMPGGMA